MNGFINVLKPVGATASDVVVCIKHILHEKVGHLGTLDPGASGVLPVAVGKATRLFNLLTTKIKYYRAFFTFGKTTDTLDSYGKVTKMSDKIPDEKELRRAAQLMVGSLQQVPPQYSAISVGGVRSYTLARNGQYAELPSRNVEIYEFSMLRREKRETFVFDIKCSGGTYIRSLARDLATVCGTVGYMSALIRLSSGCFVIDDALTLDEIRAKGFDSLLDISYPLQDIPLCSLPDDKFDDIDNGRRIHINFTGLRRICCKNVFFGVASSSNDVLKFEYWLKDATQEKSASSKL